MDNIIYNAITKYYKALSKLGYFRYKDVFRLLVLCFFRDLIYKDYRGRITKKDYLMIERALNCLFGSNCLIPYSDYLKMGKLNIGEMSELAQRVKALEETEVLKAFEGDNVQSDIEIALEDEESTESEETVGG